MYYTLTRQRVHHTFEPVYRTFEPVYRTQNSTPRSSETRILWYLVAQPQMEDLVQFEFVQRNLSFANWWIWGCSILNRICHTTKGGDEVTR